jgi:hypothetical protein
MLKAENDFLGAWRKCRGICRVKLEETLKVENGPLLARVYMIGLN